ncbi:MAG TPA: tRNA uridine-5-carboxymethylaminomethyl(34) synthesis GTPase MnmE [Thermodesulfovibrionales bacterium]|nr:tRNA uridine-5-carboxymethylaminomethyl(34) synthesis GTPase MnmE [Thermodesulfovibrionales bacterium]
MNKTMNMTDDTVAAISTPLGEGGIGIVRLSGKDAIPIAEKLFTSPGGKKLSALRSHTLTYGFIKDSFTNATVDEVLVAVMKAPRTYTKEDVIEINCHGGLLPLRRTLELALRNGARLAEPGEFTKRAFINGRIDLSQAEAVMDLIRSKTEESRETAFEQLSGGLSEKIVSLRERITSLCAHIEAYIDFPDEEIELSSMMSIRNELHDILNALMLLSKSFEEGRFFREGLKVAIVGRPNVGKSSLLNALLNRDRAIVTDVPGTTRDILEEYLNIAGLPVRIMDTAGIRETHEMAEKEGVKRSLRAIRSADLAIGIIDGTNALNEDDRVVLEKIKEKKHIIAVNKSDLPAAEDGLEKSIDQNSGTIVKISAKTGTGLNLLKEAIIDVGLGHRIRMRGERSGAGRSEGNSGAIVTNLRHKVAIDNALGALRNASSAIESSLPLEIVAMEMRDGLDRVGEVVGAVTSEDILNRIFSEFCIGK